MTAVDTSAAMAVDTDGATVDGLIGYIEKAAVPSIARVHCIVVLKALAAERDALRAEVTSTNHLYIGVVEQLAEARNEISKFIADYNRPLKTTGEDSNG